MAITQDRMISLIGAAQDYQQSLQQVTELIAEYQRRVESGELTAELALQSLSLNSRPALLLRFPIDSPTVLQLEAIHFSREKRRNARKAQKLRENRQARAFGLPKPQRGNGGDQGVLGRNRISPGQLHAAPAVAATTGFVPAEAPAPATSWAAQVPDPDVAPGEDLDLGSPEPEPVYVPGTLSPETRARLDREAEEAAARVAWEREHGGKLGQ